LSWICSNLQHDNMRENKTLFLTNWKRIARNIVVSVYFLCGGRWRVNSKNKIPRVTRPLYVRSTQIGRGHAYPFSAVCDNNRKDVSYAQIRYVRAPPTPVTKHTVGEKRILSNPFGRHLSRNDTAHVFTENFTWPNRRCFGARLVRHEIGRSNCVTVSVVVPTDLYYERIHRHQRHHEHHGPSVVVGGGGGGGERSADGGQPAPGAKKPQTPYTIEEILKPTAPRPRPPSPCGLLVDGVCTCGLAGSVVSAAFYADVQQQYMQCSQHLRYWVPLRY